ncbi:MAG: cyclodeaminase/cyclohydrolase family protein [Lachnospiraceae bacterium]|nr:cyclodeaminase/cyclohydrolase family protein [Lachnospiraceae bacterium]
MKEWTIEQFVSELASKAPVPGGGGAAALGGAVGSALGGMVGNLTVGKKKYADVEERVLQVLSEADRLQQELLYLMEEDSRAFEPLSRAYGMPKATEAERAAKEQVMEVALRDASLVPLQIMETAGQMLDLLEELAQIGSRLAISDVGVGVQFCRSAVLGASMNIFINTKMMKDRNLAEQLNEKAEQLIAEKSVQADRIFEEVKAVLKG